MFGREHQGYGQVTDKEISMDTRKLGASHQANKRTASEGMSKNASTHQVTAQWSESPRQGNVVWTCGSGAALKTLES